ncbi:amidase [Tropicibacter naphthalenivorans]|uniref:Glutamyl-tRNA(Gln) amidotransferase subunit A n=1 Tax=Tropicibacter naphthalenivorans TaxID=441103 RepID=A0A0N7LZQ4_9RHOB|nr:amidase [Tropicibacter naphthalenivorans]CUH78313.1 Glutamyl-tRNA(Gln) amidotransferase subunit A [Tropicibacter naphthalenivorans]SMC79232.1 aspartyl-tRNA(Asn)/glutamyl-tRNA(Gln) amidotransferase subunit A [Tropicibacter naphthalenivorans]
MSDFHDTSAADLGRAIAAGDLDPVELTQGFLDRAAGHDLAGRIYARMTEGRALAEAEAARDRARLGLRRHALDGVPISWKDLFDTAGVETCAGSDLLAGRVPARDAWVLENATHNGLVCLGKTHMSELAFSGLGLNPVTATSPCVNDLDAVSGGSSSGAATSVAFGLAAAAVGSDTGGSVRIPAAWNDLVGLKTTSGRLPLTGVVPLAAKFDTIGPLCRTVEDAALMLSALEGRAAPDLAGASVKGRRLAVLETTVLEDLRDAPKAAYEDALKRLEQAGAELVPFSFDGVIDAMGDAGILYTSEAWATWRHAIEAEPDKMFVPIRERFEAGKLPSAADYVAAWQRLDATRAAWAQATAGFDAVICPTAPILPPNADRLLSDGDYYVTENLLALRNTRVGNLMGGCGLTLPTTTPSCGLMFIGPDMAEHRLLRLGAAIEPILRG